MTGTRLAVALLLAVLGGGSALGAPQASPTPKPRPVALGAAASSSPIEDAAMVMARAVELNLERVAMHPDLSLAGAVSLSSSDERFGGLSGLLWEDGRGLSAISDRGWLVIGLPDRASQAGTSREVRIAPLRDLQGDDLTQAQSDAEGLSPDQKGGWFISFEGEHRIWRYPQPGAPAMYVRGAPEWAALQDNSGLEAIASAPDGAIFAIPERSGDLDRPFPVWRRSGEVWEELRLPRSGDFLVTDAAIGPDGRLYVLERSLTLLGGFAMRVRRAKVVGASAGATLEPEIMALFPVGSGVDNMEGMSFAPSDSALARADGRRESRLLVVSDDNFRFFQRTMLIEFKLITPPPE